MDMSNLNGSQVRRGGGAIMHYIGWIMLYAFTGTCTVLLLSQYAPSDAPWLPWAGLAVFEYGTIHWKHYHKHNAKNALQFLVGLGMTIISALAIAACTGMEMLSWFSKSGTVGLPPWIQGTLLYAIVVVFVLNVLAFILCSLFEPDHFSTWMKHSQTAYHLDARDVQFRVVEAPPTIQLQERNQQQLAGNQQQLAAEGHIHDPTIPHTHNLERTSPNWGGPRANSGGPRANSGGWRPGAGRKAKQQQDAEIEDQEEGE